MIDSPADLEKVIKNILTDLSRVDNQRFIDISILGSKFYQQYRKPITEQIKQLKISGSFAKFLHSCKSLQIQQVGKRWEVGVKKSEL